VLRPELVARINEKLVFNRLPYAIQREICELMITKEVERLNRLGHQLAVKAETVELLVREGFHRTLGARPMRNTVDRYLQQQVSETLLVAR
jgi:ATP-dependent Clp protease ATP-binding subunit ClpB